MSGGWAIVIASAPALVAGPVMWFLNRFDKRNTAQHEGNMAVLQNIEKKVDRLDDRMDSHFEWHMKKD